MWTEPVNSLVYFSIITFKERKWIKARLVWVQIRTFLMTNVQFRCSVGLVNSSTRLCNVNNLLIHIKYRIPFTISESWSLSWSAKTAYDKCRHRCFNTRWVELTYWYWFYCHLLLALYCIVYCNQDLSVTIMNNNSVCVDRVLLNIEILVVSWWPWQSVGLEIADLGSQLTMESKTQRPIED